MGFRQQQRSSGTALMRLNGYSRIAVSCHCPEISVVGPGCIHCRTIAQSSPLRHSAIELGIDRASAFAYGAAERSVVHLRHATCWIDYFRKLSELVVSEYETSPIQQIQSSDDCLLVGNTG